MGEVAVDSAAMTEPPIDAEELLSTAASILAERGAAYEVALLATGRAELFESGYDNWDGGITSWTLRLEIMPRLFAQSSDHSRAEEAILNVARACLLARPGHCLASVCIVPRVVTDDRWRDKAQAWLAGSGVTNQGRVRSSNIAAREADGLLFRSGPEIQLYKALKVCGVSFAPLPVFVRGGAEYRRIEPDFIVVKDGVVMAVEVDGDTVHEETPIEAHNRMVMLLHEGVHLERVKAEDCATDTGARAVAERLLKIIQKHASNR